MKSRQVYPLLLLTLIIFDAYLLSHPNLIGRFGVWFYRYEYISTFPKALLTVALSVAVTWGLVEVAQRFLSTKNGILFLSVLLMVGLALLAGVLLKFSSGTYAHTGTKFKWGFYLLPILLISLIAKGLIALRKRPV
ncbi:MAG: hypothetical protein U0Y10_21875 [Spirosomataceae bacterium]